MQANCIATTSESRKRIEKWDYVRALLIFCVVLGHMVDYYTDDSASMRGLFLFIYTFHMPCFLFLDGLFCKRTIDEKRYNHIFSYLVLYLFVQILNALTKGIIQHNVQFSLLNSDGTQWYGLCLFNCCLLTIFLKRYSRKWVMIAAIVLSCIIGYDNGLEDFLTITRTIVFFPFFFAGYCIDPGKLAEKLSGIRVRICGILLLLLLAFICLHYTDTIYFVRALLTGRNSYDKFAALYHMNQLTYYGGLLRLAYYAVSGSACLALIAATPSHLPAGKWIANIGRHTLQIYVLHRPILYILYKWLHFDNFTAAHGISNLVIIPVALLVTLFFALPVWEKPIRAVVYPKVRDTHEEIHHFTSNKI